MLFVACGLWFVVCFFVVGDVRCCAVFVFYLFVVWCLLFLYDICQLLFVGRCRCCSLLFVDCCLLSVDC